jgi:hypothetical protein
MGAGAVETVVVPRRIVKIDSLRIVSTPGTQYFALEPRRFHANPKLFVIAEPNEFFISVLWFVENVIGDLATNYVPAFGLEL